MIGVHFHKGTSVLSSLVCRCLFCPGEVKARTFLLPHKKAWTCSNFGGGIQIWELGSQRRKTVPSLPGEGKYPGPGLVGQMMGCPGEVKASDSFLQCSTLSPVLSGSSSGLPVPLPLLPVPCTALSAPSSAPSVPHCSPVLPHSSVPQSLHLDGGTSLGSDIPAGISDPMGDGTSPVISPSWFHITCARKCILEISQMSGFSSCQVPGEGGVGWGWHRSPMRTRACEGASHLPVPPEEQVPANMAPTLAYLLPGPTLSRRQEANPPPHLPEGPVSPHKAPPPPRPSPRGPSTVPAIRQLHHQA